MTLNQYLQQLGWSTAELARQASIDTASAHRAVKFQPITIRTARKIMNALSAALERKMVLEDIEGLVVGSGYGQDFKKIKDALPEQEGQG